MTLSEILDQAPTTSSIITDSFVISHAKFIRYDKILCSISGGSDSDIVLDICQKFDEAPKISYVFFDTGLEMSATKEHVGYLEDRYGITIHRVRAVKSVPECCNLYGQPFLSKQISEWIERLQGHGFKWEDESFEDLYKKYPNCKAALRWWCNDFAGTKRKGGSSFNISSIPFLKEFMIENPPWFRISNKCCYYAKKRAAIRYQHFGGYDLDVYGVRKAEGGARQSAYKGCFSSVEDNCDEYRPIFWYLSETKKIYEQHYGIVHSKCYNEYGLKRTGCAGCPYGRSFEKELIAMNEFEPILYKAVCKIFSDTYLYTRMYRQYLAEKTNKVGKHD